MSRIVSQLYKLIALATPPAEGSQEEARAAAMKACALIREHALSVYDPNELVPELSPEDSEETTKQKFERVAAENPVRRAMKQRDSERQRRQHEEREAARFRVG